VYLSSDINQSGLTDIETADLLGQVFLSCDSSCLYLEPCQNAQVETGGTGSEEYGVQLFFVYNTLKEKFASFVYIFKYVMHNWHHGTCFESRIS
jgi:hypothetical protein